MAQYYPQSQNPAYGSSPQNLQFFPSSYSPTPVAGGSQPGYNGYGVQATSGVYGGGGYSSGFGVPPAVSGRMGEQGGLRTGWMAAFGTEGYDGEPPLLEELGVNFGHIKTKTLAVLNPMARIDQHIMDDSDLAGPLLFCVLFSVFLIAAGKVYAGYIYGLALFGSTSLYLIMSLMSPPLAQGEGPSHPDSTVPSGPSHLSSTLTFTRSTSVLGYCLLPLVLTSLIGVVMPMDGMLGYIITSLAIVWCTYSSSGMFCAVGRMREMRGLVAYPLALFYVGFGIMGIFSSRGSGNLVKAAGE